MLAVALGLPAASLGLQVLAPAWMLAGVATSWIVVPWFTWRQAVVPAEFIGRITSVSRAMSYVSMPIGAMVGSMLITNIDRHAVFVVAGLAQCLVWLGIALLPLSRTERAERGRATD